MTPTDFIVSVVVVVVGGLLLDGCRWLLRPPA